jgi:hypothetical protein
MAEHTKGDWRINTAGSTKNGVFAYDEIYVYSPDCGVDDVAIAADIVDPLTGEPSIANARLISAAPNLLAALDKAIEMIRGKGGMDEEIVREMYAAWHKAKGIE